MVSAIHPATMYHLRGLLWGDIPGDRQKLLQFLKKSDCDEFNWLGRTNYTFIYSSLLFLTLSLTGLTLRVATEVASYEYFCHLSIILIMVLSVNPSIRLTTLVNDTNGWTSRSLIILLITRDFKPTS